MAHAPKNKIAAAEVAEVPARPERHPLDTALFTPRLDLLRLPEGADSGAGPGYSELLESICGVIDDSQEVEQYDGTLGVTTTFVAAHQKPAIQVQWNDNLSSVYTNPGNVAGARYGSGTMISADLMLTCGHLFDQNPSGGWTVPRQNGTANAISPQDIARSMHVNFLYQVDAGGVLRAEDRYAISQLVEFRLGGLDMAICRIDGNPGNIYGWTEVSTTNPAQNETLAIIGHPLGHPKRIEAGPATEVSTNTIRYNDIDTLGGNSGSGILQASTGRVVGVHTNGGCNAEGTGTNSGVAIAAIRAASPTLQALHAGSRTAFADDHVFTAFAGDQGGTFGGGDTGLIPDLLGSRLSRDWSTTINAADSHTAADLLGSAFSADVLTRGGGDPIGTIGGDGPDSWQEGVIDPGSIIIDPGTVFPGTVFPGTVFPGTVFPVAGLRPFIQAGAHHDFGGEAAAVTGLDQLTAAVGTVRAALDQLDAVLNALQGAAAGASANQS